MGAKPNCAWESITAYGFRWESERLIVAEKRVMTVERRGLAEEMWSQAAGEPIGSNAHYGGRLSGDATAGPSLARDRHSAKRPSKQLRMPAATSSGEPDAGNPHVRFDEGRGDIESPSYSTGSDWGFTAVHYYILCEDGLARNNVSTPSAVRPFSAQMPSPSDQRSEECPNAAGE